MKKVIFVFIISVLLTQCCGIGAAVEGLVNPPPPEEEKPTSGLTPAADISPNATCTHTLQPPDPPTVTPTPTNTAAQPNTVTISEVIMTDPAAGWALAGFGREGSQVLHTMDGGESWQMVFLMPEDLADQGATTFVGSFPNAQTAWLTPHGDYFMPADAVVFHTADGGTTWETSPPIPTYGAGELYDVFLRALDGSQAWLLTQITVMGTGVNYTQRLFHTMDGGKGWDETTLVLNDVKGMDFLNGKLGILASELEGAYQPPLPPIYYKTTDGGETWEELDLPIPPPVGEGSYHHCGSDFPHLFCPMSAGLMVTCYYDAFETESDSWYFSTTNGGGSWSHYPMPGWDSLMMIDRRSGWSHSPPADIYHTGNGGQSWDSAEFPVAGDLYSVSFSDAKHGWITINTPQGVSLYRTTDGGYSWELLNPVMEPNPADPGIRNGSLITQTPTETGTSI